MLTDEAEFDVTRPTPRALLDRFKCNPYGRDPPQSLEEKEKGLLWYEYDATEFVRALDLIPRQSALNVNDIQNRQKNFNTMGLFTWLSGLVASVSYQREQRLYQQFIQEEVYASAFGKGQSDFGWTLAILPFSDLVSERNGFNTLLLRLP